MKIKLVRSRIGSTPKQRKILDALGLRHIRQVKDMPDNESVAGMVKQVAHLVEVTK